VGLDTGHKGYATSGLSLPVAFTLELRVLGGECVLGGEMEELPFYLRTFFRVPSSWMRSYLAPSVGRIWVYRPVGG
jgi:hypothetical protein